MHTYCWCRMAVNSKHYIHKPTERQPSNRTWHLGSNTSTTSSIIFCRFLQVSKGQVQGKFWTAAFG